MAYRIKGGEVREGSELLDTGASHGDAVRAAQDRSKSAAAPRSSVAVNLSDEQQEGLAASNKAARRKKQDPVDKPEPDTTEDGGGE